MTTDPAWICPPASYQHALDLRFQREADGTTSAVFRGGPEHQGYEGLVHGGFLATLLDGVMVHGLFARGVEALTSEITVRYLVPVALAAEVRLQAWHERARSGTHWMRAELRVAGVLSAEATGRFSEVPRR